MPNLVRIGCRFRANQQAAAIADLVIWIGYLQWHFRRFGDIPPIEPVLREYHNIECRDAVLAYDGKEPEIDEATGTVRTRWGGRMMKSLVTGEEIPDPSDQVIIYRYLNPREAEWQEADYIVSNPPFIGNARMREMLGDGYAETLRKVYEDVPDTVDFVMYWWHKAAELVRAEKIHKFGFITTNTISQTRQQKVINFHQSQKNPIRIIFAIPEHPWVDQGAAVRIAMTSAELDDKTIKIAQIGTLLSEERVETPEDTAQTLEIKWRNVGKIFSNLKSSVNLASALPLKANSGLSSTGVKLHGAGFILTGDEARAMGYGQQSGLLAKNNDIIKKYMNGRDLVGVSREAFVIDFNNFSEEQASKYPEPFQRVLETVKPEREINRDKQRRENWWLFGRSNKQLRQSLKDLSRYIATVETAKHRVFVFLDNDVVPDNMLIAIALDDAYFLGVLSSRIHVVWALASGGDLGGNTPRYNKTVCFDPFPFPEANDVQKQKIRDIAERLDAHRKRVQSPEVTITAMYNLLEKLRKGEPFTDADKAFNQKALITTLKQLHDDLDAAVFEAYGWQDLIVPSPPTPLPQERGANPTAPVPLLLREKGLGDEGTPLNDLILDRLVTLNAQRAEEERNGLIRYLRPDYQAPNTLQVQPPLPGITPETPSIAPTPTEQLPFPKDLKEQLATIRDHLRTHGGEWTLPQLQAQFKTATRQKRAILDCLESLETLGILTSHQQNSVTYWYLSDLQKAS